MIKEKTLEILKKAGWFEGRNIDVREYEKNLEENGFMLFDTTKKFLKEFGGLIIEDTVNDEIHDTERKILNNAYTYGCFSQEEKYAGEKLVPVGRIDSYNLILFVSESGKVYCNTGKLGDDFLEAWENLISGSGVKAWGSF